MSCCNSVKPDNLKSDDVKPKAESGIDRRTFLKGVVGTAAGLSLTGVGHGAAQSRIRLAFCSQLLCVVPYEYTRSSGFFEEEGLNVELIYSRGGNAAMQALVGGAVEYAATSFDVALQAFANGAGIARFATTGRLPLFALATAPERAETLTDVASLEGQTVGVSALGNADHALLLYLLELSGADASGVDFATLGVNLYDALRLGQVDAGMVQEPALSLLEEDGARVLFNGMDLEDAKRFLGGPYEFMGIAVRADEREARLEEMRALSRALARGLVALQSAPAEDLIETLPSELIVGQDEAQLAAILERYRRSLYPDTVAIDVSACERVMEAQLAADILAEPVDLDVLLDLEVVL